MVRLRETEEFQNVWIDVGIVKRTAKIVNGPDLDIMKMNEEC